MKRTKKTHTSNRNVLVLLDKSPSLADTERHKKSPKQPWLKNSQHNVELNERGEDKKRMHAPGK